MDLDKIDGFSEFMAIPRFCIKSSIKDTSSAISVPPALSIIKAQSIVKNQKREELLKDCAALSYNFTKHEGTL